MTASADARDERRIDDAEHEREYGHLDPRHRRGRRTRTRTAVDMTATQNGVSLAAEARRLVDEQGWHPQEAAQTLEIGTGELYRLLAVGHGAIPPPLDNPDNTSASRTWRRVDVSAVLDGTHRPPAPTVGARADGVGLLYPGRLHTVASESEGGKTWFALLACRHELQAGRAVMFLDFEDDEGGVIGRLLALGTAAATISERFAYVRPADPIGRGTNRGDITEMIGDLRPTLAVLDGVTEAMTVHGLELKDNGDIARFGALVPRWIAAQGPAVLALDHVVKDREGRGRYAIGGVHKLNGVDGAAFVLENRAPFGHGVTGRSTVYLAKDRPGELRRHALRAREGLHWFADLELESVIHDGVPLLSGALTAPQHRDETFRPTALMAKVSAALAKAGDPLSQTGITDRVKGRAADVRGALAVLVDEGYIATEDGKRGATHHRLVRPYTGEPE